MATVERNVEIGRATVRAGDVDGHYDRGDLHTAYVDALASVLHAARADGVDVWAALDTAAMHFEVELSEGEEA